MSNVRVAVIGIGNMGSSHAKHLMDGKVPGGELAAICDIDPKVLEKQKELYGDKIQYFASVDELFDADCCDGIIIATPHYDHPPIAMKAFEKGLNVLTEKPAGVFTKDVREMNAAAEASGKIFGIMFNNRALDIYKKVKDLIASGELGDVKRNNWIITSWYRSQSYYNSGGWRATWGGEGGGVLINQCPHNLDLWQWFLGQPKRVRAFCSFGKYHDIEVEDDVTAYVEYEDGSTGVFVTSTADAPGTNRLEISADRGKLVVEDGKITFNRNRIPEREYNASFSGSFGAPENWKCDIPFRPAPEIFTETHRQVMEQWVAAIAKNDPSLLIADGKEGVKSLELSNAMLLSTWTNDWVDLPIDEDLFYEKLQEQIKNSTFEKTVTKTDVDLQSSGT